MASYSGGALVVKRNGQELIVAKALEERIERAVEALPMPCGYWAEFLLIVLPE